MCFVLLSRRIREDFLCSIRKFLYFGVTSGSTRVFQGGSDYEYFFPRQYSSLSLGRMVGPSREFVGQYFVPELNHPC